MTTNLQRTIYDALTKFLMDEGVPDVVRVTSFNDSWYSFGGCDTCDYTEYEVTLYYDTIDGRTGTFYWYGKFSDLITRLS